MGCDIHAVVEVAPPRLSAKSGGIEPPWTALGTVRLERDYPLFTVLAGVRHQAQVAPIAEPRGIPGNASAEFVRIADVWGSDGHSHSWVTLAELVDYYRVAEHRTTLPGFTLFQLWGLVRAMALVERPERVRLCFLFDN